jgi:hypothetical protein
MQEKWLSAFDSIKEMQQLIAMEHMTIELDGTNDIDIL